MNDIIPDELIQNHDPIQPGPRSKLKPIDNGFHPGPQPRPYPGPHPEPIPTNACDPVLESTSIQNMAQMRNYIKLSLGSPVICVELSDEQLNYIIGDCVRYIQKYYFGYGNYRDYMILELQPGMTHYKICAELETIVDFQTANWMGDINELFTLPHNALYDSVMSMNSSSIFRGACYGNSAGYGDILGNWNAALQWLEQAKIDFGESYQVRYNEKEKELSVWPTPRHPVRGIMEVYKRQRSVKIFNDIMFRRLVIALSGMRWCNALRKYTLQIAGGGTLNADSLYSSYEQDYKDVLEQIRLESTMGEFYIS